MRELSQALQGFVQQPAIDFEVADLTTAEVNDFAGVPQTSLPKTQLLHLTVYVFAVFNQTDPFIKNYLLPFLGGELFFEFGRGLLAFLGFSTQITNYPRNIVLGMPGISLDSSIQFRQTTGSSIGCAAIFRQPGDLYLPVLGQQQGTSPGFRTPVLGRIQSGNRQRARLYQEQVRGTTGENLIPRQDHFSHRAVVNCLQNFTGFAASFVQQLRNRGV